MGLNFRKKMFKLLIKNLLQSQEWNKESNLWKGGSIYLLLTFAKKITNAGFICCAIFWGKGFSINAAAAANQVAVGLEMHIKHFPSTRVRKFTGFSAHPSLLLNIFWNNSLFPVPNQGELILSRPCANTTLVVVQKVALDYSQGYEGFKHVSQVWA